MTPEQVAAQLKALDDEFKAGDIGFGNYKSAIGKLFDLALALATDVAALKAELEAALAKLNPPASPAA